MKIDGTVTTGLGKAAYFLSQDFYVNNFKKNCGFRPYPGTLNVIVPEEYLPQINKVKNECKSDSCKSRYDTGACTSICIKI